MDKFYKSVIKSAEEFYDQFGYTPVVEYVSGAGYAGIEISGEDGVFTIHLFYIDFCVF